MTWHITPRQLQEGRRRGAPLGGKAAMSLPAPKDCPHCQEMHYTRMSQHLGHLGFAVTAASDQGAEHLFKKIRGNRGFRKPEVA